LQKSEKIFQRAYLHVRKSRHLGDPDDPELLGTQRSILLRLAAEDGIDPASLRVIQEVESGEFLSQRAEFLRVLQEWEALPPGSGGVLYCMGLSRLSRGDPQERGRIRVALRRAGILIRTPSGTIDVSDRTQSLLVGVQSELAEYELAEFKWRVDQTRKEKVRKGLSSGAAVPFGYRWSRDLEQPVPEPSEFPVLVACCREIHDASVRRLADRYGIPPISLRRALTSPVICGWTALRHTMTTTPQGRRRSQRLPAERWLWAESPGSWPAACTRAEWEAIQATLQERRGRPYWTNVEDGWCRDVVRFVDAPPGARVVLNVNNGYRVYEARDPESGAVWQVRRDLVHARAEEALLPYLSCPVRLSSLVALYRERREAERAVAASGDVTEALARLEGLRAELQRAVRAGLRAEGEEQQAAHRAVQREIEAEIKDLQRQLRPERTTSADAGPLLERLAPLAHELVEAWPEVPGAWKRRLANLLLAAVPVRFVVPPGWKRRKPEVGTAVWQEWVPR